MVLLAIAIFFGYIDQHPSDEVIDPIQYELVASELTRPCSESRRHKACGFQEQSGLMVKGNVQIQMSQPAFTHHDPTNRAQVTSGISVQLTRSQAAATSFLSSFHAYDEVIYFGHSRFGYGPDFFPAFLRGNLVDKRYYQTRSAENLRPLRAALQSAARARSLTLISCDSAPHFAGALANSRVALRTYDQPVDPNRGRALLLQRLEELLP